MVAHSAEFRPKDTAALDSWRSGGDGVMGVMGESCSWGSCGLSVACHEEVIGG